MASTWRKLLLEGDEVTVSKLTIGSAEVTQAALEILDGATVTTAELNILDGVTADKNELNLLDGISTLSGSNTGDQTLPTDFVSKASGGTFGGNVTITGDLAVTGTQSFSSITVDNTSGSGVFKAISEDDTTFEFIANTDEHAYIKASDDSKIYIGHTSGQNLTIDDHSANGNATFSGTVSDSTGNLRQTLPTDFVSKASGGTFTGNVKIDGGTGYDQLHLKSGAAASGIKFEDNDGNVDGHVYGEGLGIGFLEPGGGWNIRTSVSAITMYRNTTFVGNITSKLVTATGTNTSVNTIFSARQGSGTYPNAGVDLKIQGWEGEIQVLDNTGTVATILSSYNKSYLFGNTGSGNTNGRFGVGTNDPTKTISCFFASTDTDPDSGHALGGGGSGKGLLINNTDATTNCYANLDFRAGSHDARIAVDYNGTSNEGNMYFIMDNGGNYEKALTLHNDLSATFAGDLTVTGGDFHSNGNHIISNSANATQLLIGAADASDDTQEIHLKTWGSTELLLGDGESVFKGQITATSGTFSGTVEVANDLIIDPTSGNADCYFDTNGTRRLGIEVTNSGPSYISTMQSNGSIVLRTGASASALTLASDQSATFAGGVHIRAGSDAGSYFDSVNTNTLNFAYHENNVTGGWVNYKGYQGGTTQFRDFYVGDGKQGQVAYFKGSDKSSIFSGAVDLTSGSWTSLDLISTSGTAGSSIAGKYNTEVRTAIIFDNESTNATHGNIQFNTGGNVLALTLARDKTATFGGAVTTAALTCNALTATTGSFSDAITSTGNGFTMTNANPNMSLVTNNSTLYVGYHLQSPSGNNTSLYQLSASYNTDAPYVAGTTVLTNSTVGINIACLTAGGYIKMYTGQKALAMTLDSSQNATFAGKVGVGGATSPWQALDAGTGGYVRANGYYLYDSNRYVIRDGEDIKYYSYGGGHKFFAGNVEKVTIGSDGNATFAGTLGVGGATADGYGINSAKDIKIIDSGGDPRLLLGDTTSGGDYCQVQWDSSTDAMWLGTDTDPDTLILDESSNATFAGDVSVGGDFSVTGSQTFGATTFNGHVRTQTTNQAFIARYNNADTYASVLGWNSAVGGVLQLGNNGLNEIRGGHNSANGYLRFVVNNTASWSDAHNGTAILQLLANGEAEFSGDVRVGGGDIHSNGKHIISNSANAAELIIGDAAASDAIHEIKLSVWAGNDIIITDDGVGIGTDNPTAVLDIATTADFSQDLKIRNDTVTMRMYASSANVFNFMQTTNNDMVFFTNDTERFRIAAGGNATFAGQLNVSPASGDAIATINSPANNAAVILDLKSTASSAGGSGNNLRFIEGDGSGGAGNSKFDFHHSPNSGYFRFSSDGSSVWQVSESSTDITFAGNIGIGSTAPGVKLELSTDTDDSNMRISTHHNTNTAHPNLIFRKSHNTAASPGNVEDNEYLGDIEWWGYHTDWEKAAAISAEIDGTPSSIAKPAAIVFTTRDATSNNLAERMRIDSSGRVGIGTSSPSAKLTVMGLSDYNLWIGREDLGNASVIDSINNAENARQPLWLYGSSLALMGGHVGIGTTAPSTTLSIVGDDGLENINTKHSNLTAGIAIGYSGIKSTGTNTNNDITIDAKGSGDISLQTNATGNVGIGVTDPDYKLEIKQSDENCTGIKITDDDGGDLIKMGARGASGKGYMQMLNAGTATNCFDTDGVSYFNGGKVGIGVTDPDAKLEVNAGTTNTTGVHIDRNFSGDAGSYLLSVTSGANETVNPAIHVLQQGTGAGIGITKSGNGNSIDIIHTGTQNIINIDNNSESGNACVYVENTGSRGYAYYAYSNQDADQGDPLVEFNSANAAFDRPTLKLQQSGTVEALEIIVGSGTNGIKSALSLTKVNTSTIGGYDAGASIDFWAENADGGTNQQTARIAGECTDATGGSAFEGGLKFYTVTNGYTPVQALFLAHDLSATFAGTINSGAITSTGLIKSTSVAIGASSASELLDIEGGSGGGHIELTNPDSGGNSFVIGVTDTAEASYGVAGSLFIRDGGSSRFVLDSSGNVGIGNSGTFDNPNNMSKVLEIANNNQLGIIINDTRDANPICLENRGAVFHLAHGTSSLFEVDGGTKLHTFHGAAKFNGGTHTADKFGVAVTTTGGDGSSGGHFTNTSSSGYQGRAVYASSEASLSIGMGIYCASSNSTTNYALYAGAGDVYVSNDIDIGGTVKLKTDASLMESGSGQRHMYRDGTALYIGEIDTAATTGSYVSPIQFRAAGLDVLHLAANRKATFLGDLLVSDSSGYGNVHIDGDLTVDGTLPASDIRLKENIRDVSDLLPIINKMEVKKFNKIGKTEDKVGIIAQQIKEFFPEAIAVRDAGKFNDTHYVETLCLVGALIGAVQELDTKVKELEEN